MRYSYFNDATTERDIFIRHHTRCVFHAAVVNRKEVNVKEEAYEESNEWENYG